MVKNMVKKSMGVVGYILAQGRLGWHGQLVTVLDSIMQDLQRGSSMAHNSDIEIDKLVLSVADTAACCARDLLSRFRRCLDELDAMQGDPVGIPLAALRRRELLDTLDAATALAERILVVRSKAVSQSKERQLPGDDSLEVALREYPEAVSILRELQELDDERLALMASRIRWPEGFRCRCGAGGGQVWVKRRRAYRCQACGCHSSALDASPMRGSHLPLVTWVTAALAIVVLKKVDSQALGSWVGIKRTATVRRLMRILRPLCAHNGLGRERLTLLKLLEVLFRSGDAHEAHP